jgi:hypothetical protein
MGTQENFAQLSSGCVDRLMGSLDADISNRLRDYSARVRKILKTLQEVDRRRALGVVAISDRKRPLTTKLFKAANEASKAGRRKFAR